jgi:hypothetical protein
MRFLGAFAKLRKDTISFVMFVCLSAWENSTPTGWILTKNDIWDFFYTLPKKIQVALKSDKNNWFFT